MVYVDDLDAMGVVRNRRHATLPERALAGYWPWRRLAVRPGPAAVRRGALAVTQSAITYHLPITQVGTMPVRFWLDRRGTTRRTYGFHVPSDDGSVGYAIAVPAGKARDSIASG